MSTEQLSPNDALEILAQAAVQYRGTLAEHESLQQAVRVLHGVIQQQSETAASEKPKSKKK